MYIGTINILYHDVGIVMGIPSHTSILRQPYRYYILGFYSMMNVYRNINYLGVGIFPTSFNHGKGSKVPFHACPKPHQIFFSQTKTWCEGLGYTMESKIK